MFLPELFTSLKSYSRAAFLGDLTAGLIVGIVALPLAIAFAIASGVTPERGITTAIVAGFLISLLGGSRVQIGGPTGAFTVIIYGIVAHHGINGLILCTIMAGAIIVFMGAFRMGAVIKFIPYPFTVGFTSGIAVVIFSFQVTFGLPTPPMPAHFIGKWEMLIDAFPTFDPTTFGLSVLALAILWFWPRVSRRLPGPIVALIAVTALAKALDLSVATIGSRFGEVQAGLPMPQLPHFSFAQFRQLLSPAFTVALLGSIESLLSATVADTMTGGRHQPNTELIAQGIANIVTPLFGGIPATGAIARTATNIKNGAVTPVAGIIHALVLLVIALPGHWASLIPLCALSAILVVVCYHMSEWRALKALLKAPRSDVVVLIVTFLLTVIIDLTVAVEIGMLLAMMLFMKRMTDVTVVRNLQHELDAPDEASKPGLKTPPGIAVYEAEGAFFFGVTELLRDTMSLGAAPPKVLILRMRHVLALDASGLRAMQDLAKVCGRLGCRFILSGVHSQPLRAMQNSGVLDRLAATTCWAGA